MVTMGACDLVAVGTVEHVPFQVKVDLLAFSALDQLLDKTVLLVLRLRN